MNIVEYVDFDERFLCESFLWLNDPEIKYLTDSADVSLDEQKKWYSELINRTDYKIWGISYAGQPIGACGLKNITNNQGEFWGYIGNKLFWGKGIGHCMVKFILKQALVFSLKQVYLRVRDDNKRAYSLYLKQGFLETAHVGSMIIMEKKI